MTTFHSLLPTNPHERAIKGLFQNVTMGRNGLAVVGSMNRGNIGAFDTGIFFHCKAAPGPALISARCPQVSVYVCDCKLHGNLHRSQKGKVSAGWHIACRWHYSIPINHVRSLNSFHCHLPTPFTLKTIWLAIFDWCTGRKIKLEGW